MKNKLNVLLLLFIVVFAFSLRVVNLTDVPPALNWDEVSHGYNSYSVLLTGRDEWGKYLPLTNFRAYGDYPLPLDLYLIAPFIKILGLNDYAIRLPHAILSTFTVIAVYFLALALSKKKNIALLAAFLTAIEPWTLFTGRFVNQANIAVFFLTAAFAAFFNREKSKILLPLSFLLLGLTLFAYHTTRIFSPILLIVLLLTYRKEIKFNLISIIILVIFFLPIPFILANPEARARSNEVFIVDQGAVNKIIADRTSSKLPPIVAKIFYNRPVYFISHSARNYLDYFSPYYLFVNGGTQYQFSIPGNGLLYLINLPLFYIGFLILLKKSLSEKTYRILFFWLLLAPIPASITLERFAVLRSTAILPIPQILTAFGFFFIYNKIKENSKLLLAVFYIVLLFFSLERYITVYVSSYKTNYSWAWQYGYKNVVEIIKNSYTAYNKIIVTKKFGEPHEYLLFYLKYNPIKYQNDPTLIRYYQSNWYWVDHFDKFYFVNDWQIPISGQQFVLESKSKFDCKNEKCLLITSPDNYPKGWKKINTINFLDNKPAFEFYEN